VGLEELVSIMSQYVNRFIEEAEVYIRRSADKERNGLVANAKANVSELFANPRLKAIARRGVDGRSLTKPDDVARLLTSTTTAIASLLAEPDGASSIPDHIFFMGPLSFEIWEQFDKQEVFSFEGHETQDFKRGRQLFAQLRRIDEDPAFPAALRVPASNLLRLLARKKPDAANEFNTLKDLKSPNTWVVLPAGYAQFVDAAAADAGRVFRLEEPEAWRDALARSLAAGSAVLPAIPRYQSFPWAAAVGRTDPLKLEQVFDDRYFLASHEFNFLNSLLLADQADEDSIAASAGVSLSVSADIESG